MKIAIIGLGYVGLPLSLQFARNGVTVVGIDIDPAKDEPEQPEENRASDLRRQRICGRSRRAGG